MSRRLGLLAALLLSAGWLAWLLLWDPMPSDGPGLRRADPAAEALDVEGESGVDAPTLSGRTPTPAVPRSDDASGPVIRGRVLASDPEGLHRLRVKLVPSTGRLRTTKAPDYDGRFRFEDVEPGSYQVVLLVPHGLLGSSVEVEVADRDVEIELLLRETVEARITVVDESGAPIAGAQVSTDRRSARTDEEGVALLKGLDPERVARLTARPPKDSPLLEWTTEEWSVRDARVVLELGLEIRGRVVDEDGKPVEAAVCWYMRAGHVAFRGVTTDAEGRFCISRLRAGLVRIQAEPGGEAWPTPPSRRGDPARVAEVQAGAHEVELVVPRGVALALRIVDWPADGKGRCHLCASGATRALRPKAIATDGTVRFRGLDPDTAYEVWVPLGFRGERFAYAAAARPGPDVVTLTLQEGESITVRVELPEEGEVEILSVQAGRGAVTAKALPHPDVAKRVWTTSPLPPGRWLVSAYGRPIGESTGRVYYGADGEAEAGGTITLKLERLER